MTYQLLKRQVESTKRPSIVWCRLFGKRGSRGSIEAGARVSWVMQNSRYIWLSMSRWRYSLQDTPTGIRHRYGINKRIWGARSVLRYLLNSLQLWSCILSESVILSSTYLIISYWLTTNRPYEQDYTKHRSTTDGWNIPALHSVSVTYGRRRVSCRCTVDLARMFCGYYLLLLSCLASLKPLWNTLEFPRWRTHNSINVIILPLRELSTGRFYLLRAFC